MGKHGLAVDNLISANVVTADGQSRTASAAEHPDLFWVLRGGGGDFGVVTSAGYRLHEVSQVLGGMVRFRSIKHGTCSSFIGITAARYQTKPKPSSHS